jgi:hypothetical protein
MAAVIANTTELGARTAPVVLAQDQGLPVSDAAAALLPRGVLRQGMAITVRGPARRSVALALACEASATGSWVACVGLAGLGLAAAEEFGLDLSRLALIDHPGDDWAMVLAALVGAVDVIIAATPDKVRARDGRRLAARLRERGSVIIELQHGAESVLQGDVVLQAHATSWQGLHRGHGRLTQRRVMVATGGRGAASRGGKVEMWLPGASAKAELISAHVGGISGSVTTYDTVADIADLTARLRERRAALRPSPATP